MAIEIVALTEEIFNVPLVTPIEKQFENNLKIPN